MAKITVEINGKSYPCFQTMGALMLLEQQTGKSVDKCTTFSDQCVFLWACCKSACRREGIEFPYTVEEFADNLTPEALMEWTTAAADGRTEKDEASKKK